MICRIIEKEGVNGTDRIILQRAAKSARPLVPFNFNHCGIYIISNHFIQKYIASYFDLNVFAAFGLCIMSSCIMNFPIKHYIQEIVYFIVLIH